MNVRAEAEALIEEVERLKYIPPSLSNAVYRLQVALNEADREDARRHELGPWEEDD